MTSGNEQPFKVAIPDADIELLRKKLELTTFPDELENVGWDYGVPLADVQRLVARWKDGYDWRKAEAEINAFPQFTRDIEVDGFETLNIHYVHQRSTVENAIPLLFVHGWPGHFMEARKIIPLLTAATPDQPSFHVVALSLPGYGFSEAPKKKGFSAAQYAEVGNKLMLALGYNEFVTQGGDWGYRITRTMAHAYGGKTVKAWHTNFAVADPPSFFSNPITFLTALVKPLSRAERAGLERSQWFRKEGRGYFHEQSTRPQTLGYSLASSPVGLLAWIYEKLVQWTDGYPWEDDEGQRNQLTWCTWRFAKVMIPALTWISIYWFSRAGPAASVRIYYEISRSADYQGVMALYSRIPLGLSFFPKELAIVPRVWTRSIGNVVSESEHEHGGHFAAHERPEDLANDVRKMFAKGGPAYSVVSGKSGYA
ncbi:alpha/beta-hydrolase [Obba rivulosa]|uniref:Alpha/beta-hydrolase n=1 Tax=Obba rivulosa TaxID=1052685 RepID=A0A8E2DNR9_9APHY|nr:alpha/beta-hydrolase [Obba rivulosa]